MKHEGLTPMQEAFAAGLAKGMTQAAAYRKAYPKSRKWSDKAVWSHASGLAANGLVQGRVAELVGKAASANEVTVERVVNVLPQLQVTWMSAYCG